jgi:hypothetical protein
MKNLDRAIINGDWNVVLGYSPIYDCINCTFVHLNILPDNKIEYITDYYYSQGINGPLWVTVPLNGVFDEENGVLNFDGREDGLPHSEHWYILHADEESWSVYYCGEALSWHYEGSLTFSRSYQLTDPKIQTIKQKMLKATNF